MFLVVGGQMRADLSVGQDWVLGRGLGVGEVQQPTCPGFPVKKSRTLYFKRAPRAFHASVARGLFGLPTPRLGPADLDSAGFSAVGRSSWVFGRELSPMNQ